MSTRSLREVFDGALAWMEQGSFVQALAWLNVVIDKAPAFTPAYIQRGSVLCELGRWEQARADYERALELEPANPDFQWMVSMVELQLGNLGRGWELYESRWRSRAFKSPRLEFGLPLWEPGKGFQHVLVWYEQGIGDQILYASLLNALQACTAKVTAQIDARLVGLFSRANPGITFIAHDSTPQPGAFDAQIPLGTLGRHFAPSLNRLAAARATRYLQPLPQRARAARAGLRLDAGAFVVGLSWASTSPSTGPKKSVKLNELIELWQLPQIEVVSIQFGPPAGEAQAFMRETGHVIRQPGIDTSADLEGLAALLSVCDAVVTVSNSNAHIAGALGVPVHVLDARQSWYWSHEQSGSSLWYPSVRVHAREHALAPWAPQVQDTIRELGAAFGRRQAADGRAAPGP